MTITISRRVTAVLGTIAVVIGVSVGGAFAASQFVDNPGPPHGDNIDAIVAAGITAGCTDPQHYCPGNTVTRAQMATFLARALGLNSGASKNFPRGNGRGQTLAYCSLVANNPRAFDPAPCAAHNFPIDQNGPDQGATPSAVIGSDGLPIVSYYDASNGDLLVAHCQNVACSLLDYTTLDNGDNEGADNVGSDTSIAIGADGLAIVSYLDATNTNLRVAHCADVTCTGADSIQTLDNLGTSVGFSTSITIGGDDLPAITYFDLTSDSLKFVHCSTATCSASSTPLVLDSTGDLSLYDSIATGTDGFPVVAYYYEPTFDLRVIDCANALCTGTTPVTIDSGGDVGKYASLTIGSDGLPVIGYYDDTSDDLKVAHCSTATCSSSTTTKVESTNNVGSSTSIAIGPDGMPVLAYRDLTAFDLKFVRCTALTCSTWVSSTLDTANTAGISTSTVVGVDGVPLVFYYDSDKLLKAAHPALT